MTEAELEELLHDCPSLFHMAEEGSWSTIATQGLLSTTALLDHYDIEGKARDEIERRHRPASVDIGRGDCVLARIRDQIPMSDKGLLRALPDHISPSDWYAILNSKVFFWLTQDRLQRLLMAKSYKDQAHDVLEVDARSLVQEYRDRIWLCPINSGCTKPFPHPRNEATFQRIETYPYAAWKKKRRPGERVVELAVDYSVPDLARFTKRVTRRRGETDLGLIWEAP